MAGAVLFARPPSTSTPVRPKHWILGVLHGVAQIALALGGTVVWQRLPFHDWPWPGPLAVAAVAYWPIIGLLSTEVVALYLLIASQFNVNVNELFAGQSIEDAKSFLRMHIASDGTLTIHPLGVGTISRDWVADPGGDPHTPWLHPRDPLAVHRIEDPIVVR
jgi:hypothetical protein